jgi:hypothetical protein
MTNNSFTAGPTSTASRFYNPHRHNRFLSGNNYQTVNQAVKPIFQNNFVLPIAFGQAATKTFYSKNASKPQ